MAVKGFDAREEFAVVADGNQDLCVRANGRLKNREGSVGELVLLELGNLVLATLSHRQSVSHSRSQETSTPKASACLCAGWVNDDALGGGART